jgi:N-acyl-phosphatidylethanolamine-hydrolysing phospholipase D
MNAWAPLLPRGLRSKGSSDAADGSTPPERVSPGAQGRGSSAGPRRGGRIRSALALSLLSALAAEGCGGVGGRPPGAPAHHRVNGFQNTDPDFELPATGVRLRFILARLWAAVARPRRAGFPVVANDGRGLRNQRPARTITWVGHSTFLLQLDGVNVLTDPHWSERASPLTFVGPRRITPPGLAFEDLPPIHLVLVSHDHYDHLDARTVRRLARAHDPLFLVPLGLKAWLARLGVSHVEELDWWERRSAHELEVTCLPVQHWSSRTPWDVNHRLWSGWALAGPASRVFFAGDTGYSADFREIGARLGPFDLALVAIGAYMPRSIMRMTHTTPEEALRIFEDVRARRLVAMHWGTFDLSEEPPEEPPRRLARAARDRGLGPARVWIMTHGETRAW